MRYAIVKTAWTQPNSILPAHNQFNKVNTQLSCMKHCYNANEMQCIKIKYTKPIPKFLHKLINFETPKILQNSKLRVKCMINEWERIILDEEHLIQAEDQVKNVRGLSLNRRNEIEITKRVYIEIS